MIFPNSLSIGIDVQVRNDGREMDYKADKFMDWLQFYNSLYKGATLLCTVSNNICKILRLNMI